MPDTTISNLPAAASASSDAVVAADNAAGTLTEKVTLGQIAALSSYDQSLNTTDAVTFDSVSLPNGTQITVGSFDNMTGGQDGISLHCAVGYELNWQGGRLRSVFIGDNTGAPQTIYVDSPLAFPGVGTDNMQIDATGLTFPDGTTQTTAASGGGSLSDSDRYIICKSNDDIAAKYADAKALTPGDSPLSATNRAYLVIMPGVYPLAEQWEIDGEFVDIIGLGSSSLDRGCNVSVTVTDYDINVSANDVKLKGIGTAPDHALKIDGDKPLQVFEECKGGDNSFAVFGGSASGTFKDCSGGNSSFGGGSGSTASGTFTNCSGGDSSFGGGTWVSGGGGTASGTFTNCSGGGGSFGGSGGGTASGTFKDCSSGSSSFGGSGSTASGTFTNCSADGHSFGFGGTASGTFTNCSGGWNSFGGWGLASGTFTNCSAGNSGFGGTGMAPGTASGKFLRCTLINGSFPPLTYPGIQRLCIDGSYSVINSDAPTP